MKRDIQYNHDEDDKAAQLYTKWQLDGILPISDVHGLLGDQGFVVIGDFAYSPGYDGCLYMTPMAVGASGDCIDWTHTICIPDDVDGSDFPLNQLKRVVWDMLNVEDIMGQHGIRVNFDRTT